MSAAALPVQAANVSATVDRHDIRSNETLQFSFRVDDPSVQGEPDFSALELYFDIVNRRQSRQLRIINGDKQSWIEWQLTLAPKVEGVVRIPAIDFAGGQSQPVRVEIRPVVSDPATASRDAYVELIYDADQPVYVGQQLLLKVRLASAVPLSSLQGTAMDITQGVPAEVIKLDEQQYEQIIKGRRYGVYEITYAVFAQAAGELEIPVQQFTARVNAGNSLFDRNRGQRIRLKTQAKNIAIKPVPDNFSGQEWLVADQVQLDRRLTDGPYRVGEPLTLTLTLNAQGVTAPQLPELRLPGVPGVKVYPDQPKVDQQLSDRGLRAQRQWLYGLVPTQPGILRIPSMTLYWWDAKADEQRRIELPAQQLEVQPAALGGSPATSPSASSAVAGGVPPQRSSQEPPRQARQSAAGPAGSTQTEPTPHLIPDSGTTIKEVGGSVAMIGSLMLVHVIWACCALALLYLGYRWGRKKSGAAVTPVSVGETDEGLRSAEQEAFAALQDSCRDPQSQLPQLRQHYWLWAHCACHAYLAVQPADASLQHLLSRMAAALSLSADDELVLFGQQLDRLLYRQQADEVLDKACLLRRVAEVRQQLIQAAPQDDAAALPQLYP